jgi:hypothetical protein
MKSTDQIVDFIVERIGHIYFRPLMYGGSASGVDTILHYYHELWSIIFDEYDNYQSIRNSIEAKLGCGSANFSTKYKMEHSNATEKEVAFFAVDQWMLISEKLGILVPYEKIKKELKKASKSLNINKKLFS